MVHLVDDGVMAEKSRSGVCLKYKQRNVSAIRRFPVFCGRNSPMANQQPINSGGVCTNGESREDGEENGPLCSAKPINDAGISEDRDFSKCCGNIQQLIIIAPTPFIEDGVAVSSVDKLRFETTNALVEPSSVENSGTSCQIGSPLSLNALNTEFLQCQRQKVFPINAKPRKGGVVFANRTFPDGCGRGATLFNAKCNEHGAFVGLVKSFEGGVVSANLSFHDGCEGGATLSNAKCNEHGVKVVLNKNLEVGTAGVFADPSSVGNIGSPVALGSFKVAESSDHDKSLHLRKTFLPETIVPMIKLEANEPTENLEPSAVDTPKSLDMMESTSNQIAPLTDKKTRKNHVVSMDQNLSHNLSVEDSDGAHAKLSSVKHSGYLAMIGAFDIIEASGLVGSPRVPKDMIPETANGLEDLDVGFVLPEIVVQTKVLDHTQALDPVEAVEGMTHKKYPPRRRVSACRDFPPRFAMDAPSSITKEFQALGKSLEDARLGNNNAGGQNSDETIVIGDTHDKKGKFKNENINESRLQANILITEEVGDDAQVKSVQSVDKLVHSREVLERKMEEEDMDETSIQSPHENNISQSVVGSLSFSKRVDRVGSEDNLSVEFARSSTNIGLKRKFSGNPGEESSIVTYQMQGFVDLEHSKSSKFPCELSNSATDRKGKNQDIVPLGACQIAFKDEDYYTRHDKEDDGPMPETSSNKDLLGKPVYDGNEASVTCREVGETVPLVQASPKKNQNIVPLGACQITFMDEDYYTRHDKEDDGPMPETSSNKDLLGKSVYDGNEVTVTCREVGETIPLVQASPKRDPCSILFDIHSSPDRDDDNETGVTHNFEETMCSVQTSHAMDVSLIPFGHHSSLDREDDNKIGVIRIRVRETLRLFQGIVRKLLQDRESKLKDVQPNSSGRVDLLAGKILKKNNKWVNTGKPILGVVPGVEVGDEFHYRVELAVIGLHRPFQAGIDCKPVNGKKVATSIVASGGYADIVDSSDVLVYSGHGGIPTSKGKKAEDQKLERGNLALKNSFDDRTPVRVIRGYKGTGGDDFLDSRGKVVATYTYDGLYLVEKYWEEKGRYDTNVFKFQLKRIPGQPELAIKEVKKSNKLRVRKGLRVDDISEGKEKKPICAINTVDNEDPPRFKYITNMMYPSWYNLAPPEGCGCVDGCSDSENCVCARRNGGEIPFNCNGDIVEAKPLVYECGPSCKCPPTCHNRVSQHGIKFRLEIFKTESRGWGVRSLNSIPSGSFICEYTGELLQDKEAEQRISNDEYLFDIGHNYNDRALWEGLSNDIPVDSKSNVSREPVEEEGFTIDAAYFGSVGRFLNHSCSPNLYAQNVLYDHDDKRMPHIMLFAAENIPPLQELTYHYNYELDQVHDSDGNIKKKNCYCGSVECTGRMY